MTELSIKQMDLFPTPVWQLETGIDCKPIKSAVQKLKNHDRVGSKITNVGGWQSAGLKPTSVDAPKELELLFSLLDKSVKSCLDSIGIPNLVEMKNCWFNINKMGNFNKPHKRFFW